MSEIRKINIEGDVYKIGGEAKSVDYPIVHRALKRTSVPGKRYYYYEHIAVSMPNRYFGFGTATIPNAHFACIITIPTDFAQMYSEFISDRGDAGGLVEALYDKGCIKLIKLNSGFYSLTSSPNFEIRDCKVVCVAKPTAAREFFKRGFVRDERMFHNESSSFLFNHSLKCYEKRSYGVSSRNPRLKRARWRRKKGLNYRGVSHVYRTARRRYVGEEFVSVRTAVYANKSVICMRTFITK